MQTTPAHIPLVLVVDDDATMRLLMRHTLKKAGFEVEEASDGPPAVALFQVRRPDVVLLDVMMPLMDGFAACHELRKLPGGENVPILLVTGLDDMDSINRAYEAGATDFITKPITFPLLAHRVRYVLRAAHAMERVGKSEARLAHAQAIAHLGNWEWNVLRNEVHWSSEIYRILGVQPGAVVPHFYSYLQQVHPDDRAFTEEMLESRHQGEPFSFDHRIVRPDGTVRIVHLQGEPSLSSPQEGGPGQLLLMNGTVQDITERKQTENELRQYRLHLEDLVAQRTAELTDANSQLLEAKDQAEQANNLKDKFVSLVAHDLRSPLAGILAALEYMHTDDETPLNEEHHEIVGRLLGIGKSLVQMIGDVLNISRLKTGKITARQEFIDAHETVTAMLNNLSYLARQKGVELSNEIPAGVCLYADPTLYGEVLQNLTSNSIKFCKKGDKIRFYMPDGQPSVIAVADTGIGIPAEAIPKLFRIEEKTSTPGTAGEQGTGFGLPFSQDIMRAHGGTLRAESTLGVGSTFFVELPPTPPSAA